MQHRLAAATPAPWTPPERPLLVAGCFTAFARGEQGPGRAGDRAWVGAALVLEPGTLVAEALVPATAAAAYGAGRLAAREGEGLARAVAALPQRPDVLLVDATGRDHPRGAGLALHLGAALDVASVGVTHRPLLALGLEPGPARGDTTALWLRPDPDDRGAGAPVARWVRTQRGTRPLVAHAGWRTDADVAAVVVLRMVTTARTPEPLRQARRVAREARSHRPLPASA